MSTRFDFTLLCSRTAARTSTCARTAGIALSVAVLLSGHALAQAPAPAPAAPPPAAPAAPPPVAPAPPPPAAPAPLAPAAAAPLAAEPAPGGLPAASQPVYPAAAPGGYYAAAEPAPVARPSIVGKPSEQASFFMGYEIGLPTGSLGDFVSDASFRGFDMGGLWPVWRGLYLGPVFSHHTFNEHEGSNTYLIEDGAITADFYTYARFWTMAGLARYHFLPPDAFVRPYVGLRMGMTFVTAATLVADLSIYYEPLGFALSPEVGLLIRALPIMHINVGLRYDFTTASEGPLDNASFLPFHLGLVFHKRP